MNNTEEQWKKNFQDKLSDYKRPGSGMTWADIEKKVRLTKRRKQMLYWLGAASIAAVLAIFFVSIFNQTEPRQHEDEKLLASSLKIEKSYLPDTSEIVTVHPNELKATDSKSSGFHQPTAQILPSGNKIAIEEKEYRSKIEQDKANGISVKSNDSPKEHAAEADQEDKSEEQSSQAPYQIPEEFEDFGTGGRSRRTRIEASIYAGAPMGTNTKKSYNATRLMAAPLFNKQSSSLVEKDKQPILHSNTAMNTYEKHYQPVRYGISTAFGITERFSIGTGLYFSVLKSKFGYNYNETGENETIQTLCYLGIPINATYRFVSFGPVYAYSSIGLMAEMMVYGDKVSQTYSHTDKKTKVIEEHPFQFSTNMSLGLALNITNGLSFYAEPGVSYYIKNNSDLKSFYNNKKVSFNLNIGFRVNL